MEDLARPLAAHPFLAGLDEPTVRVLVGCAKNVRFGPGDFLLREGDPATTFYLLRDGRASLEIHIQGAEVVRVETVGPGDFVGLSWMFPPSRVHLDVRALEPTLAVSLDGACLRAKMEAVPALGYALTKRLLEATYHRLERVRLQRADVYGSAGNAK